MDDEADLVGDPAEDLHVDAGGVGHAFGVVGAIGEDLGDERVTRARCPEQRHGPIAVLHISRDLDLWAYQKDVVLDFSRPGKPTDNGFIESFNGKLRAECLNTHWFMSLDDARAKMEDWRRDYNEVIPVPSGGDSLSFQIS